MQNYVRMKTKGEIIFPKREDFINGLARSKVSICVPSNITHPERSGVIETMTNRYLQSMASKCLIVGHAPKEMIEIFGYNPVIEIDSDLPEKQLSTILDHYTDYIPLVEKNYETVSKYHTWERRWEQIKDKFKLYLFMINFAIVTLVFCTDNFHFMKFLILLNNLC